MSFVSITRLRVRSLRYMPAFLLTTWQTQRQVTIAAGFQGGSLLADRRRAFWTMTAWDSQDSMRRYMTGGHHRKAMPRLLLWCDEASVVHWEQHDDTLPAWPEADRRMRQSGRASKVLHPSPDHQALTFQTPRVTGAAALRAATTPSMRARPS